MKNLIGKIAALSLAAIMVMSLCSCGAKEPETIEGLANPIVETDAEGLVQATGIALDAPEGAEDVTYAYINQGEGENLIAQVSFSLNGKSYNYRAVSTSETVLVDATDPNEDLDKFTESIHKGIEMGAQLAGLNYEDWNAETIVEIAARQGVYGQSHEDASFVAWLDVVPGFLYSLTAEDSVDQDTLLKTAESAFVPMQGEVG